MNDEVEKDDFAKRVDSSKTTKTWQSAELFGDAKRIQIEHRGEIYQLRITRQGKLILNK